MRSRVSMGAGVSRGADATVSARYAPVDECADGHECKGGGDFVQHVAHVFCGVWEDVPVSLRMT